jgi:DNA (cytosine-5)-methyltransferase 1
MIRFGSLFSGIEAASVAWEPLGWRCAWTAEIDPFARAVLRHRYPQVPNLGDVNEIDVDAVEPVDLVVFGSPCQSFSVAGKRLGLDDPRGNMALVGLRVVGKLRPRWVVWENVPGVLSSDGGRDFGAFLGLLGELGYGFAYRVLDAQHFGVPQRRRRVFVVGYLGDWRPAAAVLFEPESLRGDSAPSREAGKGVARPVASCAPGGCGYRCDADTADNLIAACWTARDHKGPDSDTKPGHLIASTLRPPSHAAAWRGDGCDNLIAFSAKDHGGDCGETAPTLRAGVHHRSHANAGVMPAIAFQANAGRDFTADEDRSPPLRSEGIGGTSGVAIAYGLRSDLGRDGEAKTPSADAEGRVRLRDPGFNILEEQAPTLDAARPHAVAYDVMGTLATNGAKQTDIHTALRSRAPGHSEASTTTVVTQAFPDPAYALSAGKQDRGGVFGSGRDSQDTFVTHPVAGPLTANGGSAYGEKLDSHHYVAHSLRADGFDASEDGTGRGDSRDLEWRQDGTANAILTPNGGRAGIGVGAVAQPYNIIGGAQKSRNHAYATEVSGCLQHKGLAASGNEAGTLIGGMSVRRLTPRECERLQGLPDDYTLIPYRGKPAADGPRYRAIGNSMAVPVMRWIGERIQAFEDVTAISEAAE